MKLIGKIENYLCDFEYKIVIKNNKVNIINYDEIIDFSLTKISVRYKNNKFIIEGKNLVISKMFDNEVLINGNITNVIIN